MPVTIGFEPLVINNRIIRIAMKIQIILLNTVLLLVISHIAAVCADDVCGDESVNSVAHLSQLCDQIYKLLFQYETC